MAFGYTFTTLDTQQKHLRRHLLDTYALVAQSSILLILALFQLFFLLLWLTNRGLDYERPRSPSFNKRLEGKRTWLRRARQACDRAMWWLRKDGLGSWGTRAEWLGGGVWTVWLLYLCIARTGNDYLHLTKRFGAIGASQLPLHYLLAMRAPYSPIQWLTRLSHEQLNASHRVLGRIIFLLFALHAAFYLNFFVQSGFLAKRSKDKDVIFGIISLILFSAISTTALGQLRHWNYRVFYVSHVVIACIVVVPLYLHVHHIRPFVWEVVAVNVLHTIFRAKRLRIYSGSIKLLPGTDLVQIRIPLTNMGSMLAWQPGQHVYLSRPTGSKYSSSLYDQFLLRHQTNPFTVASIPTKDKVLLLVARTLNGNTRKLAELARLLATNVPDEAPGIPIALEGPYGAAAHLPDFTLFDKVLLVAGGVGATFIMPVYRSIIEFHDPDHAGHPQVRFIWAVRKLADTQWALPEAVDGQGVEEVEEGVPPEADAIEVFVTQGPDAGPRIGDNVEEIELAEDDQLLSMEEEMKKPRKGVVLKAGRPKIASIVDGVFSKGTKVAVVCCGPRRLTRKLRDSVEQRAIQGHEVYWHEESFGW